MTTRCLETIFILAVAACFLLAGVAACNTIVDLTDHLAPNRPLPDTPAQTTSAAGAVTKPAAYTPLLASQAEVNAMYPHDR